MIYCLSKMIRPKALLLGDIVHAQADWDSLSSQAELVKPGVDNRAAFITKCQNGEFDGVFVIYRTWYSVSITGLLDQELVNALPKSAKFLCHSGAGYDQIDIAACTKRGICVSNVPSAVNDATADTAIFLMLGALRGFSPAMIALRQGEWRGSTKLQLGHDPEGKILGILGCGGIGRNLARKAKAFGMTVKYHNRVPSKLITEADYSSFDDLIRNSDAHTRHRISTKEFEMMKDGVVVINTARGPIVDEEALVAALKNGRVWSCGLDVYENEPIVHQGLLDHPRCMLLPHLGTFTIETQEKMEMRCISNVRTALETGELLDLVPEQSI